MIQTKVIAFMMESVTQLHESVTSFTYLSFGLSLRTSGLALLVVAVHLFYKINILAKHDYVFVP